MAAPSDAAMALFAQLFALAGTKAAPQEDAASEASRAWQDTEGTIEKGAGRGGGRSESGEAHPNRDGTARVGAAGAPLTIHSLNERLLQQEGGASRADAGAAASTEVAARASGRRAGMDARGAGGEAPQSVQRAGGGVAQESGAERPTSASGGAGTGAEHSGGTGRAAAAASSGAHGAGATAAMNGGSAGAPLGPPRASVHAVTVVNSVREAAARGGTGAARVQPVSVGGSVPGAAMARGGVNARAAAAPTPASGAQARAEVFQAQVARGMAAALERGQGTFTLRVKPEALGQLNVKVSMKDGVMTAHFQAETREARDLLVATTPELQRSLEAAGVGVERIEASIVPRDGETPGSGNAAGGDTESAGGDRDGPRRGRGDEQREEGALTDERREAHEEELHAANETHWLTLGIDTIA